MRILEPRFPSSAVRDLGHFKNQRLVINQKHGPRHRGLPASSNPEQIQRFAPAGVPRSRDYGNFKGDIAFCWRRWKITGLEIPITLTMYGKEILERHEGDLPGY